MAKSAFRLASAVKALDVNAFLNGLSTLQTSLEEVYKAVKTAKDAYDQVKELYTSGQQLRDALEKGLSFDHKRAWYTALRGTDTLLQTGRLADFETIVCEASCRRALPFQWGVCQRLGNLAVDTQWDEASRLGAVAFLGQIYRDDVNWGQHIPVKQIILDILMQLATSSDQTAQGKESVVDVSYAHGGGGTY